MAAARFIGREMELKALTGELSRVREGRGRLVVIRGRRRVGKSRLVQEFLSRTGVANVFFTASRQASERELQLFQEEVARSAVPLARVLDTQGVSFASWEAALTLTTADLPGDEPLAVVIDEFPYLLADDSVEGSFQKVWDRTLAGRRVLLILVGSDLSAMEALTTYGRPLFGRTDRELVIGPLTPFDLGRMLDLDAPTAFDAYLLTGGFPQLAERWRDHGTLEACLRAELSDPTSPLIVNGERALAAEFPHEAQARLVCEAIGYGQRTHADIGRASGLSQTSLARALEVLLAKRLVQRHEPLSTRPSRLTHYEVADPYLRFWLRFVGPQIELVERGRGSDVAERALADWQTYRGRAIEPVIRHAIERLSASGELGETSRVGSFWTRRHDVEVDIVGTDGRKIPRVTLVGSVKWREARPFDETDLKALALARRDVPGATTASLVGVSRSGFSTSGLDCAMTPDDVVCAWEVPSGA